MAEIAPTEIVTKADYEKAVERARTFESKLTDVEKKLEGYKDIDPVKYKAVLEDYDLLRKQSTGGDPKKIDELVTAKEKEIRSSISKEIEERDAKIQKLTSEAKEMRVVDKVFALAAGKFNSDTHEDVKEYIRKHCDLNEKGEIVVKDGEGKAKYRKADPSALMTADDFVAWLSEIKPSWAIATAVSGTKQPGTKSTPGSASDTPPPGLGHADLVSWFKEHPAAMQRVLSS